MKVSVASLFLLPLAAQAFLNFGKVSGLPLTLSHTLL